MSGHTAGPWVWQRDEQQFGGDFVAVYADGATGDHLRAQVFGDSQDADADLIAAAPDMLAALRDVRVHLQHCTYGEHSEAEGDLGHTVASAIAKAEGNAA